MPARSLARAAAAAVAAVAAITIAVPTLAQAFAPHTTWYQQHPNSSRPRDNVSIIWTRNRGSADLYVTNFCLGSAPGQGQGANRYPFSAEVATAPVHGAAISFAGRAREYAGQGVSHVTMHFSARLMSSGATGSISFPGTRCGTISFAAKLAGRTS
jgi:hypothetical protein